MTVGIYCITNKVNDKRYIGQSIDIEKRIKQHKRGLDKNNHYNDYLQRAYNKYTVNNFKFNVLIECSENRLDYYERYYIQKYDTINRKNGYNLESGGNLNKHCSEESRKKMSKAKKGKNHPFYGKLRPEETRKKLSELNKGENNPMYGKKGKLSPRYGKKHTEESKKKMSESLKGRKMSEETKKRMSESRKGKYHIKNTKQKMSIIRNKTGFYHISKNYDKKFKKGFNWVYDEVIETKRITCSSVSLKKLRQKVFDKGLEWSIIDKEKAIQSLITSNEYNNNIEEYL